MRPATALLSSLVQKPWKLGQFLHISRALSAHRANVRARARSYSHKGMRTTLPVKFAMCRQASSCDFFCQYLMLLRFFFYLSGCLSFSGRFCVNWRMENTFVLLSIKKNLEAFSNVHWIVLMYITLLGFFIWEFLFVDVNVVQSHIEQSLNHI